MPPWGTMGMSDAEIWLLIGLMRTEPAVAILIGRFNKSPTPSPFS